jgi:hypothetical protein
MILIFSKIKPVVDCFRLELAAAHGIEGVRKITGRRRLVSF